MAESEAGSQPVVDTMYFNVTDNAGNVAVMLPFTVTVVPVDDQVPMVKVTGPVQVIEGGRVALSLKDITISDLDTPPSDIHIIMDDLPTFGILENIKPSKNIIKNNKFTIMSDEQCTPKTLMFSDKQDQFSLAKNADDYSINRS